MQFYLRGYVKKLLWTISGNIRCKNSDISDGLYEDQIEMSVLLTSSVVFSATFTFVNHCGYPVWPAIRSNPGNANLSTTGFALDSGGSFPVSIPAFTTWSGRTWARTLCSPDSSTGKFTCLTGDCGTGAVGCDGGGEEPPATLAEFTLNGSGGLDKYSVSLVHGYNVPMIVTPQGGDTGGGNCKITGCVVDLNIACPSELKVVYAVSSNGDVGGDAGGGRGGDGDIGEGFKACRSACDAFGDHKYCGKPSAYSELFKHACPLASIYALDRATTTFSCAAVDYVITFCPFNY